ncbi:DNA circularization protein [Xenorhabdus cabanillasii]|uniref:DNA circulation protein n=1 Tax=Xenorhabdus cabanillasii JM26 TaxID=1427517 RepID=W1IQ09_9GAMM|nr:DNA circularization N-terminal domain-containing protein [Xenorhabdus cabanillasii]PHM78452.1 DNA circulation protein [Xenorhabdus cabanillasii JM26]CDL79721.1 putative DNA circulation protein [Xenorhabdus cabanillasii JM26]
MQFDQFMTLFNDTSWRSRIGTGKGTFRNVPFYIIDDATVSGGRRVVRHEYPLRDDGETEDMGLTTREYSFTAVVFGDDYFNQRDALITALETAEPGEMDHPYYGKQQVQIETYTVRESCYTGGVALFSVTFIPAADHTAPLVSQQPELDSNGLTDSTLADITANWETVTRAVNQATERLNAIENTVNTIVNGIRSLPANSGMNQLLGAALALKGSLKNLINAPFQLFDDISGLISGMAEVATPDIADRVLRKTSSGIQSQFRSNVPAVARMQHVINTTTGIFIAKELAGLTLNAAAASARGQQLAPALTQAPQSIALSGLAVSTQTPFQHGLMPFETSPAAALAGLAASESTATDSAAIEIIPLIETLDDVRQSSAELDETLMQLIVETGDLGWFRTSNQLRHFRLVLLQQMQATASALPTARSIQVMGTEPALVTLYRETGGVAQINRFIRRNGIRHPAFVSGGLAVEVIHG